MTALKIAIGAESGTLPLDLADGDDHANFGGTGDMESIEWVLVRRLDDVPEVQALSQIDFLKIDVEGWEPAVMVGARRLWRERRVSIALIKANPPWGSIDYLNGLAELGYNCFELLPIRRFRGLRSGLSIRVLDLGRLAPQAQVLVVRPDKIGLLRAALVGRLAMRRWPIGPDGDLMNC